MNSDKPFNEASSELDPSARASRIANSPRHQFFERRCRELGVLDPNSDYHGMIGAAVLDLSAAFAAHGHSGQSARITRHLFEHLFTEFEQQEAGRAARISELEARIVQAQVTPLKQQSAPLSPYPTLAGALPDGYARGVGGNGCRPNAGTACPPPTQPPPAEAVIFDDNRFAHYDHIIEAGTIRITQSGTTFIEGWNVVGGPRDLANIVMTRLLNALDELKRYIEMQGDPRGR